MNEEPIRGDRTWPDTDPMAAVRPATREDEDGETASATAPPSDEISGPLLDADGYWLSVAEAVAYCTAKGLNRNIKTIRRWAHRSVTHPESAEVNAAKQDTETDFRYVIERSSLDTKIAQELEFEAKTKKPGITAHDHPGPDMSGKRHNDYEPQAHDRAGTDLTGQIRAGADMSGKEEVVEHNPRRSKESAAEPASEMDEGFLVDQLSEKDRQIGKLHEQLERRDKQIMAMLERDRETNILIKGLQEALLPLSWGGDKEKSRRLEVRSFTPDDGNEVSGGTDTVDKDAPEISDYEV